MNKYVSIVPLRAGSKGLKDKNIKILHGNPLYSYSVKQGLRTTNRVIITTDISSVIATKFSSKVKVLSRKKKLAEDNTSMLDVLVDLFQQESLENYIAIILQATSPLRTDSDIINAINMYESGNHSMIMSVTQANKSVLKYGFLKGKEFIPILDKESIFKNRQSLAKVYRPNGAIYIFSIKDFMRASNYPDKSIGAYEMSKKSSIDIDSEEDFNYVEKLFFSNR